MMQKVHLIGIGGTGLSAIALVLAQQGYTVSGSDRQLSPAAQALQARGVQVIAGHRAENVQGADLVVRSSAIPDENVEVQAALAAGIPVLKRADFLSQLIGEQRCLAVAGTHGKTTTTAMLAWTLTELDQDPSYIVGGMVSNLGSNAAAGHGPYFVIEADEYDRMFLGLQPYVAVVTNVEHDHPDCFPTPEDYRKAFMEFTHRITPGGALITCKDDAGVGTLSEGTTMRENVRQRTYGTTDDSADFHAEKVRLNAYGCPECDVMRRDSDEPVTRLSLQVPGEHNLRNALAVLAVIDQLGLDLNQAARALNEYHGSGRRFELRGEIGGITIIDDYAHHPTEIRATLSAARARFPGRRIWAIWQPHTYSRTRALFDTFTVSFRDADEVIVTEIYPAREPREDYSAAQLVTAMHHPSVRFAADLDQATRLLLRSLEPGDVMIVLSAGDADQISASVLATLRERMGQNA